MDDIHDYQKRADKYLKSIRDSDLSECNKRLIDRFVEDCYGERLTPGRVYKHLYHLKKIVTLLNKDLSDVQIEDLKRLMRILDTESRYTESTKKDFRITVKKFWKWMNGGTLPDQVKWIKTEVKHCDRKLPEELLTEGEVMDLLKAADNPRDKAFILVLFESGCRIGEMMGVRLKHVSFDQFGAKLVVQGKTGARRVRIILGCDYLRYWLENHPRRDNPEAHLWVNLSNSFRGEQLSYHVMRNRLREIARKAGILKKVNFHNFRHSRATQLANKLTESQLCEVLGWTLSSRMPATYVHLSGRNVDDALLNMYGIKNTKEEATRHCPRCRSVNEQLCRYCRQCGLPFGVDIAMSAEQEREKYDGLMSRLMESQDVKEAIARALDRMKNNEG
jgi:site-specific recombinase XerD